MGEGGRGWRGGIRRVGPRPLDAMRVRIIFLVGVRTGHVLGDGICGERRKTTIAMVPRAEQGVVVMMGMVVRMTARTVVITIVLIAFHLRRSSGEQVDIHA